MAELTPESCPLTSTHTRVACVEVYAHMHSQINELIDWYNFKGFWKELTLNLLKIATLNLFFQHSRFCSSLFIVCIHSTRHCVKWGYCHISLYCTWSIFFSCPLPSPFPLVPLPINPPFPFDSLTSIQTHLLYTCIDRVCIHEHYLYRHGLCMCLKSRNHIYCKHRDEITSYDSLLLHTWISHYKGLCRHVFQKASLSEKKRWVASVFHSRYTVSCLGSFLDMIDNSGQVQWLGLSHAWTPCVLAVLTVLCRQVFLGGIKPNGALNFTWTE